MRRIAALMAAGWGLAAGSAGAQAPATPDPAAAVQVPAQPAPQTPPAAPTQPAPVVPTPPPAASAVPPGTPATVLDVQDFEGLIGRGVRSAANEDMGRIIDVILDREGRARAAIIDFGGFLGVGSRKIAVDWRALQFGGEGRPSRVVLQLSRNQVRVSPEYKPGEPIVVLGPASPSAPPAASAPAAPGPEASAAPAAAPPAPPPSPAPAAPPAPTPTAPVPGAAATPDK